MARTKSEKHDMSEFFSTGMKTKKIVFPVITAAVAILIMFVIVIPKIKKYKQQKRDYNKFCQQLEQIPKYGEILSKKRHSSQEMAKKWEALSKKLRHLADEKDVMKNFVNPDARSSVRIQSFERNYEREIEVGKSIYFELQVQGYFEDIRTYLEQLEHDFPIIFVTQLSIKPDEHFSRTKPMLNAIIQGNVFIVL